MILSHEGCRAVDPLNSTKILRSSTSNVCSSSPENDPSQERMLRHDRTDIRIAKRDDKCLQYSAPCIHRLINRDRPIVI